MKVNLKIIPTLALFGLILPLIALAQSPGIPHKFYGAVTLENGTTPNGLTVESRVDGNVVGTSVTNEEGNYGYSDLLLATDPNGNNEGKEIKFYVSGIEAEETATFENGASSELSLTIPGEIGTIEADETEVIEDRTMAISSSQSASISLGNSLNVIVSSVESTNAKINIIEKLTSNFYTGSTAVISGSKVLNGFEINIEGENLVISASIKYDDSGINEDSIKLYKFDGTSWVEISPFSIDKTANKVTFEIKSASTPYTLFGQIAQTDGDDGDDGDDGGSPGGGGGSSTVHNVTGRSDINNDGNVDILDFNQLMVEWGNANFNSNIDINEDNKVDILDFNLLMVNWTG